MLNFGASKPRVKGGPRPPGPPGSIPGSFEIYVLIQMQVLSPIQKPTGKFSYRNRRLPSRFHLEPISTKTYIKILCYIEYLPANPASPTKILQNPCFSCFPQPDLRAYHVIHKILDNNTVLGF